MGGLMGSARPLGDAASPKDASLVMMLVKAVVSLPPFPSGPRIADTDDADPPDDADPRLLLC
jgi:hypothetical protein